MHRLWLQTLASCWSKSKSNTPRKSFLSFEQLDDRIVPTILPTVNSGSLFLHLDADRGVNVNGSGTVIEWTDQSANGFVFQQTTARRPDLGVNNPQLIPGIFNDPNAIRFDGIDDVLFSDNPLQLFPTNNSSLTVFTLFETEDNTRQQFLVDHNVSPGFGNFELGTNPATQGAGQFGVHQGNANASVVASNTVDTTAPTLMTTTILSNGSVPNNVVIHQDGQLLATQQTGSGWLALGAYRTDTATLQIGARFDNTPGVLNAFHQGSIFEIIIYQGALNDADRQAVEQSILRNFDQDAPTVVSIERTQPSDEIIDVDTVTWTAIFSEAVRGVDASDFELVTTGTVNTGPIQVNQVDPDIYEVTVSGITGGGSLQLNLVDNGTIEDVAGRNLVDETFPFEFINGPAQRYSAGTNRAIIDTADFNNDGNLDIAVPNNVFGTGGGTVSVTLGNGDGTFQAPQSFFVGIGSTDVAAGDLNNDGAMDLVVANQFSDTVSILLGNGDGTFQAQTTRATFSLPTEVELGDLNNDGNLDIVVTNLGSDNAARFLGNGDGTFGTRQSLNVGSGIGPFSLALEDVDNDTVLDLIVTNQTSNNVTVRLGNGNGNFGAAQVFATGVNPFSVDVNDINGDGIADIAVANFDSDNVSILIGNGDGTFQPQTLIDSGTDSAPAAVLLEDVNQDGIPDLIVGEFDSNVVSVHLNDDSGNFRPAISRFTNRPRALATGDVNNDGQNDLIIGNQSGTFGEIYLYDLNAGTVNGQAFQVESLITIAAGDGQTAAINTEYNQPIVVTITDRDSEPLVGTTVTFAAPDTGPSVTFIGGNTAETDANGRASVRVQANGTSGDVVVTASNPLVPGTVEFSLTNSPFDTVFINGPNIITEGQEYVLDLQVNRPVAGVITSWTVNFGDGTEIEFDGNPDTVSHIYDEMDAPNNVTITAFATVNGTVELPAGNNVLVDVVTAEITETASTHGENGERIRVQLPGNEFGLTSTLTISANENRELTLFVGRYNANPEDVELEADQFLDVRVSTRANGQPLLNVPAGTDVLVVFRFRDEDVRVGDLVFFDPVVNDYVLVQSAPLPPGTPAPELGEIVVLFNQNSTPTVGALGGTVFTVELNRVNRTTPVPDVRNIPLPSGSRLPSSSPLPSVTTTLPPPTIVNGSLTPAVALATNRLGNSQSLSLDDDDKPIPIAFKSSSQLAISLVSSQDSRASRSNVSGNSLPPRSSDEGDGGFGELLSNLGEGLAGFGGNVLDWLNDVSSIFSDMPPQPEPMPDEMSFHPSVEEIDAAFAENDADDEVCLAGVLALGLLTSYTSTKRKRVTKL